MSKYQDRAMELRHDPAVHYNCAQVILMSLHESLGISEEQAKDLGTLFAGGMYCGATCGAITGALMALGLAGQKDPAGRELITEFQGRYGAPEEDVGAGGRESAAKKKKEGRHHGGPGDRDVL